MIDKKKPDSMGENQWKWHYLIEKLGSEEAANKEVAKWLREMADEIEKDDYPMVFSAHKDDSCDFMTSLHVVTSYPWPG